MTVSDLYQAVAKLGFENSLEDDGVFLYAANRALLQVNAIRPHTKLLRLHHAPIANLLGGIGYDAVEKGETDLIYTADGARGYAFEADGHGACYIERQDSATGAWQMIRDVSFDTDGFTLFRGLIDAAEGLVRLRFVGEYLYYIRGVALYGRLRSGKAEDVPAYGATVSYDLTAMADDFMDLAAPPMLDGAERVALSADWSIEEEHILHLPREAAGNYLIEIHRRPKPITEDEDLANNVAEIDLDEDLCALLPNLIASYVWADDEPEKAQYYLSLYREQSYSIEAKKKNLAPPKFVSVNGW
jgi:hypothetical protein